MVWLYAQGLRERFFLLAYSDCAGLEIPRIQSRSEKEYTESISSFRWAPEPSILRVANGVPSRVDRIKCLGNAVVPAQAELAWKLLTDIQKRKG